MFKTFGIESTEQPVECMRYNTAGDWTINEYRIINTKPWENQTVSGCEVVIKTARTGNWRYDALLQVHELIEAILCINNNVQEEDVSKFDMSRTPDGPDGDCGDDPLAPYSKEHCFATAVERMLCAAMGVEWDDYESRVSEVMEDYTKSSVDIAYDAGDKTYPTHEQRTPTRHTTECYTNANS